MLQAVELLGSCLGDVAHASEVLSTAGPGQAMAISQAVSEADARAEEASGIVRSLVRVEAYDGERGRGYGR